MFKIADYAERIDGISILVGTAQCNANCSQCAGRQHRKNAPRRDGEIDAERMKEVLDYCYAKDCRYITLTGSGEPTLSPRSVTKALEIIKEYGQSGKKFEPVNLYTNGIRIGFDSAFCEEFLPTWKSLGLTSVYVSAYSGDEIKNTEAFGIKEYPSFKTIFGWIKKYGFKLRTSVILKRGYVDNCEKFEGLCKKFFALGVDNISVWPLKNEDDSISELAPSKAELTKMRDFVESYPDRAIRLLLGDSNTKEMLGKKIALFQNGEISDVWCARR